MTEDEVVLNLVKYLEQSGWRILKYCLGGQRGIDITATKDDELLLIEAKGAKGKRSNTTRKQFDSGQIKTHYGKAIVRVLEEKTKHPGAIIAIAHPNDEYIKKVLSNSVNHLEDFGIEHYWVAENEDISKGYI